MNGTVFSAIRNKGLARGFVVQSLAGHDQGKPYVVICVEGSFVYLADGGLRPYEKPKKKRVTHVRPLGALADPDALDMIGTLGDSGSRNSAVRRILKEFFEKNGSKEET